MMTPEEATAIKEAANWCCERCGHPCYLPGEAALDRGRVLCAFVPATSCGADGLDETEPVAWCAKCLLKHDERFHGDPVGRAAKAAITRKQNQIRRRIEMFRQIQLEFSDSGDRPGNDPLYSINSAKLDQICREFDPDHPESVQEQVLAILLSDWGVNDQRRLLHDEPADRLADRVRLTMQAA